MILIGCVLTWLCLLKLTSNQTPLTADSCVSGCLICSTEGVCLLCDFTQGLYYNGSQCAKSTIDFCETYDTNGSCLVCKAYYYLDQNACKPVPENKLTENCDYFDSTLTLCNKCRTGFFLKASKCATQTKNITNCATVSDDGASCVTCTGQVPDYTFQSCTQVAKPDPNCRSYGFLTCLQCSSGYIYETNNYIYTSLMDIKASFLSNYLAIMAMTTNLSTNYPVCRKLEILNCDEYERFDKCKKCIPDFFLTPNNTCQQFPEPKINNCEIYASSTVCKLCSDGFYKKYEDECVAVTQIANCKSHSRIIDKICEECNTGFYLYNNQCEPRVLSKAIQNCQEVFTDRDLCRACGSGFVLNLDFASCLPNVNNCKTHVIINGAAQCAECFSGFFIAADNHCEKGAIMNCDQYRSETECLTCMGSAYVAADKTSCVKHNLGTILSCDAFSSSTQNYCDSCIASQVRFSIENFCMAIEKPIDRCVDFSDGATCAKCNSTISYLSANQCVLGTIKRCTQYHATQHMCLICENDSNTLQAYVPNTQAVNNTCVLGNPNLYFNCKEIDTTVNKFCLNCDTKYYPVELASNVFQYCVPSDFAIFPTGPKVLNCTLFDYENNLCKICNSKTTGNMQVSYLGSCMDQCPEGTVIQSFEFDVNKIASKFNCKTQATFSASGFTTQNNINCYRYDFDQNGSWVCAQCGPTDIALFDVTYNGQRTHYYSYMLTASPVSYYSPYNKIMGIYACLSATSAIANSKTGTKLIKSETAKDSDTPDISNCYMLSNVPTTDFYSCIRCSFGYSGKVVRTSNAKGYMIEKCELISDCKVDVWYNGLSWGAEMSLPLDFYVNCHACTAGNNPSQIPTFGLTSDTVTTVTPNISKGFFGSFGIPNKNSPDLMPLFTDSTSYVRQTSCQTPGLTQSASFPLNCGAQALYIDKKLNLYLGNDAYADTNPICVICQPGYKPTYSLVIPLAVKSCEKIAKCASSSTFNICEQCETGFALKSASNNQVCVLSKVNQCYIVNENDKCVLCQKGYILSIDGTCDTMGAYKCSDKGYNIVPGSLDEVRAFFKDGVGCQKCESKFVLATFTKTQQVCVKNNLIESNNEANVITSKIYIKNCEFYGLSVDTIVCKACKAGFIPQESGTLCWSDTLFANCKTVFNGGIRCGTCIDNYYYDSLTSKCVKGNISNCLTYKNIDNCLKCASGFIAVSIAGGRTMCFDTESLNCQKFESVLAMLGTLKCETCNVGYFLNKNSTYGSFPLKNCLKIPEIKNCKVYNKETDVFKSFLTCKECTDEYYLETVSNSCKKRSVAIPNCKQLAPLSDGCNECVQGFYLEIDAKSCIANSIGIIGCIDYSNQSTCLKCDIDMYLVDNLCKAVEPLKLVKNCKYYKNSFECLQCNKNFFLDSNVCEQSLASNCKTFVDIKTCETCDKGYGLSRSFNITSCLLVQVKNCEIPDTKSSGPNFTCLKCSPSYFLNSTMQCSAISTKITSCKYYKNNSTCSQCSDSLVLANDGKKCLNLTFVNQQVDRNCLNTQLAYGCNACKPGFLLENGLCVECKNNTVTQGCWQCNPYNQKECLMCKTGTVHTKSKVCAGANYALLNSNLTGNATTNATASGSALMAAVNCLMGLLFFVLNA